MPAEKIHIELFLEMAQQHPVLDVRSPGEFSHAHIPGACSLPLFTDEERKVVGTLYKQQGRELAIKSGLNYFGPKMNVLLDKAEEICAKQKNTNGLHASKTILVYCWRGGMRSAAVAWLLDLYGFKVFTLVGGYKKFRNEVLETFSQPFRFQILGGYTGSGKTELLKWLKEKGASIIDLEQIAGHKGSAFGNIGLPQQPSQEMFENILTMELKRIREKDHSGRGSAWIEDESQRIGHVNIPGSLWNTMRCSPVYFLDIPFDERLKHITEEYGCLDLQKMTDAIGRIKEKLGGLNAKNAIQLLQEGNTVESFRILLKYYDTFYLKSLHNRENLNTLLHSIVCKTVTTENALPLLQIAQQREQNQA